MNASAARLSESASEEDAARIAAGLEGVRWFEKTYGAFTEEELRAADERIRQRDERVAQGRREATEQA